MAQRKFDDQHQPYIPNPTMTTVSSTPIRSSDHYQTNYIQEVYTCSSLQPAGIESPVSNITPVMYQSFHSSEMPLPASDVHRSACKTKRGWNDGLSDCSASTVENDNTSLASSIASTSFSQPYLHYQLTNGGGNRNSNSSYPNTPSSPTKKSRPNNYIAPRVVARTFNSEVGSLVGAPLLLTQQPQDQRHIPLPPNQVQQTSTFPFHGLSNTATSGGMNNSQIQNNLRGHFRRQLSGSKIEAFLSNGADDAMEVDAESNRPRSMSF